MATGVELASRALVLIGIDPITSFTANTAEAQVAKALYEPGHDAFLASHPWSFTIRRATLTEASTVTDADRDPRYDHAYELPDDFLRAVTLEDPDENAAYEIVSTTGGTRLVADAGQAQTDGSQTVTLAYVRKAPEADFPAWFEEALVFHLAARFCPAITENTTQTEALMKAAEDAARKARSLDGQQQSKPPSGVYPLIEARRGG